MFRLISDDIEAGPIGETPRDGVLRDIFSQLGTRMYAANFGVTRSSANSVSVQLSLSARKRLVLAELRLFNHKGFTYATLDQTDITEHRYIQSYNLTQIAPKEWIPDYAAPLVEVTLRNGQLCSSSFTQLQFTHVALGTSRLIIEAQSTSLDCPKRVLFVLDLSHHVPQLLCYDAGDTESCTPFC